MDPLLAKAVPAPSLLTPDLPLTHRLPQLVQCVCIPCLAGPEGDSEEATLCGQDKVISWGWQEMAWVPASDPSE